MAVVQLYGIVDPEGNKSTGSSGWSSRRAGGSAGLYLIIFEPRFTEAPTVVATQIFPNDLSNTGGDTRDNAVIVGVDNNEVKIKTGDGTGKGEFRWFSFIVQGTRA